MTNSTSSPAHAVTIHRSQRSEYQAVVILLAISPWMMLQRNLLCTAITRAKKLAVLAGSRRALAVAVRAAGAGRRHTALTYRLNGADIAETSDDGSAEDGPRVAPFLPGN